MEAGVLDGAGNTIRADGETVTLISNDEGAGGGGAGGTLVLRVDDIVSTVIFSVRGGKGGDTQNILFPFNCHGPGGGAGAILPLPWAPGQPLAWLQRMFLQELRGMSCIPLETVVFQAPAAQKVDRLVWLPLT